MPVRGTPVLRRFLRAGLGRLRGPQVQPPLPIAELLDVYEAWPAVAVVFPEPYVHRAEGPDLDILALDPNTDLRPLVLPPVLVNDIPGGAVRASGLVEVASGQLLLESAKRPGHVFKSGEVGRSAPVISGEGMGSTVLAPTRWTNYFHWVVDMLPRLYALEQAGDAVELVCPEPLPRFASELLERFRSEKVSVRRCPPDAAIRYDAVRFSPFTTTYGHGLLRPEIAAWLRQRLLGRPPARRGPGRRLYVRRVGTRWNCLANDEEVAEALRPLGVEPVRPELLELEDQLELFSDAELIVGPHGAGLTNMVVAEGASVVDIHPNGLDGTRMMIAYWSLARSSGHRYYAVRNSTPRYQATFTSDVDRVRAAVELALDRSPTAPVAAVF